MTHRRTIVLLLTANLGCIPDAWIPPAASDAGALIDRSPPTDAAEVAVADQPAGDAPTARCEGPTWRAVQCGDSFCCAIRCEADVWCWGRNDYGQLGVGDRAARHTPTRVIGLPRGARELATGYNQTCTLLDDGAVWCWGLNSEGILGAPTTALSMTPVRIEGTSEVVTAVASGGDHACVLSEGGGLACWGGNSRGQLGNGLNRPRLTPQVVKLDGAPVAEVVCGQYHTCARRSDGTLACWGQNTYGTLANGRFLNSSRPVEVTLPAGVRSVDTSANHVYAALDDGSVWSWGYNEDGQLGNGSRTVAAVPVQIMPTPAEVVAVVAGHHHGCALSMNGSVRCWGRNAAGQLGDGTTTRRLRPGPTVELDEPATTVAIGQDATCVILRGGSMRCWGNNREGQLGDGTTEGRLTPVRVLDPG
jgi:alpha-tubulin suppressor-like RCC1 family protein